MEEVSAMNVRVKFSKQGPVKFIGHLDTMRYFQKAIRRAELPIAYSGGFSPHMILSFAAPLGVGVTSQGEYFDMQLTHTVPTKHIEEALNQTMAEGFQVLSARKVEDGKASKAMSLVAAADYCVTFRQGHVIPDNWEEKILDFYGQPSIVTWKKTKRSEKEVDIKPSIYRLEVKENRIYLRLAALSGYYTKPDLVLSAFFQSQKMEFDPLCIQVERLEVYADKGTEDVHHFISLEELGEEVE